MLEDDGPFYLDINRNIKGAQTQRSRNTGQKNKSQCA